MIYYYVDGSTFNRYSEALVFAKLTKAKVETRKTWNIFKKLYAMI